MGTKQPNRQARSLVTEALALALIATGLLVALSLLTYDPSDPSFNVAGDRGEAAKHESSVAKAYVAEAVDRVVDNAVQICGGTGVSGDGPLARLMNEVRPFRIYDGPTETHLWSIARRQLRARAARRADPVDGP